MGQQLARVVLPPLLPPASWREEEEQGQGQEASLDIVSYTEDREEEVRQISPQFPDLTSLPPELALSVLRHLGATGTCTCKCT